MPPGYFSNCFAFPMGCIGGTVNWLTVDFLLRSGRDLIPLSTFLQAVGESVDVPASFEDFSLATVAMLPLQIVPSS